MKSHERSLLRQRLLRWFRRHARPLPWRADRDPYRIWISEVMLQQTQVATVIPFFERFLTRFPTLTQLAEADEQAVLHQWEGLGYYRRARDLWSAARQLHDQKLTTIPDDRELVAELPGFGRYTTNAVLSQAYDRRLPILEANSQRVLCRLFGISENPKETAVQKRLWQLAEMLVPKKGAGDFNQALMELGALVCTPSSPRCRDCPIQKHCDAFRQGRQDEIPARAPSAETVAVEEVALVIRKRGKLMLVKRPEQGRWANMWEFPHHPLEWMESYESAANRLMERLGIEGKIDSEIATIRHSVTRFRITMVCLAVAHRQGAIRAGEHAEAIWVRPGDLHTYPLSVPQRRLARIVLKGAG